MEKDQALVHAILTHQPGAFEHLVDAYQKLVWHIVYRMAQDPATAEDLCQEVFLRVHLKLATFRFESSLYTWIGRIAFHIVSRYVKKGANRPADPVDDPEPLWETLPGDTDLEALLVRADLTRHVQAALRTLPPLEQTFMTLYYWEDRSVQEISEICRRPVGTVKNYLYRARAQICAQLAARLKETP